LTTAGRPSQSPVAPALSPRIDWRFLLSTPDLGHVGVLEGADEELQEALRVSSSALTVVRDFRSIATATPVFDLVVLADPPTEQVVAAAQTLRRDGWVYVEVSMLRPRPLRRPRVLSAYVTLLRRAGLDDVAGYWHLPDIVACEEIVQLGSPGPLAFVFSRRRRRTSFDRTKDRLAILLARSGLLGYLAPFGGVVGRRGGAMP
jgi:hypothetical protein